MVSGAFCFGEAWNGNSKGIRFAGAGSHFAKSFRRAKIWELQFCRVRNGLTRRRLRTVESLD